MARDVDGRIWAIQAKRYSKDNTVIKRDIDTFMSETSRPEIQLRPSIPTNESILRNNRRAPKKGIKS